MLSEILSVTGRPGLYKLISTNKNMNIVESLTDGKRVPIYSQEKVVALSDVSIYTQNGDTPLRDILKKIKENEGSKQVSLGSKPSGKELFAYLEKVLPDYSRDSVYAGDVKKLISWYNILIEHNIDFEADKTVANDSDETGENDSDKTGVDDSVKPGQATSEKAGTEKGED